MSEATSDRTVNGVSIVIPAFNEENGIAGTIQTVRAVMQSTGRPFEIVVVNDGSRDKTAERAAAEGVAVISLPENRGYGFALKTGIRRSTHPLIAIIDADGTYPAEALPRMLDQAAQYDMVVGARTGTNVQIPLVRRPAKWFLRRLAAYLVGRPIPDLNSGLRVIRRDLVHRFEHLLPSGFSFTTTITMAALSSDALVWFEPIDYRVRVGESKIRPRHAFDFLILILRTIVYFNPMKVFLPIGAIFFIGGLSKLVFDIVAARISETTGIGFLGAAILWAVGLISDQIARVSLRPGRP
jgi:glycosyltransferase involved in cell wall biosynthesis